MIPQTGGSALQFGLLLLYHCICWLREMALCLAGCYTTSKRLISGDINYYHGSNSVTFLRNAVYLCTFHTAAIRPPLPPAHRALHLPSHEEDGDLPSRLERLSLTLSPVPSIEFFAYHQFFSFRLLSLFANIYFYHRYWNLRYDISLLGSK